MTGYTIKSESDEGIYYLVKGWDKHKTFWIEPKRLKHDMLYKTESVAKASLTKLLKIMEDYRSDKFSLVFINNGKIVYDNLAIGRNF